MISFKLYRLSFFTSAGLGFPSFHTINFYHFKHLAFIDWFWACFVFLRWAGKFWTDLNYSIWIISIQFQGNHEEDPNGKFEWVFSGIYLGYTFNNFKIVLDIFTSRSESRRSFIILPIIAMSVIICSSGN